jgi:hypothetical protein
MKVMQEMRGSGIGSEYTAIDTDSVDAWALDVEMLLYFSLVV